MDIRSAYNIEWPSEVYERRGPPQRLCGIKVFCDFPWTTRFTDQRTQFRGGLKLARYVLRECPDDRTPALLLTMSDVKDGLRDHPEYFLMVVNIERYLAIGGANAVAGYFAQAIDPRTVAALDFRSMTAEEREALSLASFNAELLRTWLRADQERVAQVTALLQEFDRGVFASAGSNDDRETLRLLVERAGDSAWEAFIEAKASLPALFAHQRIWQERRAQCEEFERQLRAREWAEHDWQQFFEQRTWIFGYGLHYQFLHQLDGQVYAGGQSYSRTGGQITDFMMSTGGEVRFTVFVEIKKPNTALLRPYRVRTYSPSVELAGGVAQLQQACWRWAHEGSRTHAAQDGLERDQQIYTHEPRGILVIGDLAELGYERDKITSFESFRRNLKEPEILTFDEVLGRAKQIVQTGEADAPRDPSPEFGVEPMATPSDGVPDGTQTTAWPGDGRDDFERL